MVRLEVEVPADVASAVGCVLGRRLDGRSLSDGGVEDGQEDGGEELVEGNHCATRDEGDELFLEKQS